MLPGCHDGARWQGCRNGARWEKEQGRPEAATAPAVDKSTLGFHTPEAMCPGKTPYARAG